jgi:hypothetical protein
MAKKPRKRFDTLGNLDMIKNSVTAIKHHADELTAELKKNPEIEAWVLSKVDRAAQNLSDVTHYLDGEMNKFADGGMMAETESVTVAMEGEADEIENIKSYFKSNFYYDFDDENISDYGTELYFYNVNLKIAEFVKRWVNKNFDNVEVSIYVGGGTMADGGMMAKGGMTNGKKLAEIKDLKLRLELVKDDIRAVEEFINENGLDKAFSREWKEGGVGWSLINNIQIESDLNNNDIKDWNVYQDGMMAKGEKVKKGMKVKRMLL